MTQTTKAALAKERKKNCDLMSALRKIYKACQHDDFGMEEQCYINNLCVDMGADK